VTWVPKKEFYVTADGYCLKAVPWGAPTIGMHRLAWENANGPIPPGMIIHHRNGVRSDNRLENLEMMSRATHLRVHAGWVRGPDGHFTHKPCCTCKRLLPVSMFYIDRKRDLPRPDCKECVSMQHKRLYIGRG